MQARIRGWDEDGKHGKDNDSEEKGAGEENELFSDRVQRTKKKKLQKTDSDSDSGDQSRDPERGAMGDAGPGLNEKGKDDAETGKDFGLPG